MEILNRKPIYEHDCNNCQFLGTYDGRDMYICYHTSDNDGTYTLLVRCGKNESYSSFEAFEGDISRVRPINTRLEDRLELDGKADPYHAMRVAYLIARDAGFIGEDGLCKPTRKEK